MESQAEKRRKNHHRYRIETCLVPPAGPDMMQTFPCVMNAGDVLRMDAEINLPLGRNILAAVVMCGDSICVCLLMPYEKAPVVFPNSQFMTLVTQGLLSFELMYSL